jgi:glutathione S-transferase
MLTIYGVHRSRAFRNIWLAEELGIPYRQVPVIQAYRLADPSQPGAPLHTRSPEFLAINPSGHIPSIDDDGLILHESLAINLYLARKHDGPLAPKNLSEEGEMIMWSFFAVTEIETNALKIQQTHGDKLQDTDGGREVIAACIRLLRSPFGVLDRHLARTGFLVGGRFSVADLNVAETVRYAMAEPGLFEAHSNVDAWLKACHARPAFKAQWEKRLAEPV